MKRSLFVLLAAASLLAAACGGSDKKAPTTAPSGQPTDAPVASATPIATLTARPSARTTPPPTGSNGKDVLGGLFNTVFTGALSGGEGLANKGFGAGDPRLVQYLPSNADLPAGYTSSGQYTFRAPDGISSSGGIDIAAEVATTGDATAPTPDFSTIGVLMAMVLKPDDLQSLGSAFDSIKSLDQKGLEDALLQGTGTEGLFKIKDAKVLDAPGLGDGGAGFQMTIDLGGFGSIFKGLSDDSTPVAGAPDLSKLMITMRMYLFARGDYAGGILRMAFADTLANDVDEVALAKIIDEKLRAAR